ncbi:hypothetical protein [Elizabethkingia phage TCUEAP1]|nr:hypothetical protein [Elizabethkingia phage TCUEAP1]
MRADESRLLSLLDQVGYYRFNFEMKLYHLRQKIEYYEDLKKFLEYEVKEKELRAEVEWLRSNGQYLAAYMTERILFNHVQNYHNERQDKRT